MSSHRAMTAAIETIYAAATGQAPWPAALDRMAEAVGFTHWSVYASDRDLRAVASAADRLPVTGTWSDRYDASAQRDYEAEYYKHARNRHYYLRHPDARICHDLLYVTEAEMDRDPFYAWAERDHGVRYMAVGLTDFRQAVGATVGLTRARSHGAMSGDEAARLAGLLDHFQRALNIEYRMGGAVGPRAGSLEPWERSPTGMVAIDRFGRVVLANPAAQAMAQRCDAFTLARDGVRALRPCDDPARQRLIGRAVGGSGAPGVGGGMRLPRRSGRRDYVLIAAPLARGDSLLASFLPAACLLITDPEAGMAGAAAMLRDIYGITPAEQRLIDRLMLGDTPGEAADALGVSLPTVRTQLASVFRKTDTTRQAELIRMLISLPWWSGSDSEA